VPPWSWAGRRGCPIGRRRRSGCREEEADAGAEGHSGRKKMWLVATGHVIERPKHNILSKLQVS
jgi:hypothetical protein